MNDAKLVVIYNYTLKVLDVSCLRWKPSEGASVESGEGGVLRWKGKGPIQRHTLISHGLPSRSGEPVDVSLKVEPLYYSGCRHGRPRQENCEY